MGWCTKNLFLGLLYGGQWPKILLMTRFRTYFKLPSMRSSLLVVLCLISAAAFGQEKKVARPNIPGSFIVDLGVNRALNTDSTWKQGFWGSRTVNLYYQYPIRFGRSKFSFNPGIGLSLERWKYRNNAMLIDTVELVSFPNGAPADPQVEQFNLLSPARVYGALANKSMLVTNYVEIPLEFRFDTRPEDIARSFNVALGGRVGYLFDAFTKVKYENAKGDNVKVKDKFPHGLNQIRYGVYARVGIGGFNWFAFYNLSEMFEEGKGPRGRAINTFTAGISINGF